MSRLNPSGNGEYLLGVGGGGGNLHVLLGQDAGGAVQNIGAIVRPLINAKLGQPADSGEGSGWMWRDRDVIGGQFCGDGTSPTGCSLWFYNLRTGALSGPFSRGANNGYGRGGVCGFWLGNYPGADEYKGVWTTDGYHNAIGAVAGVYDNGDVLVLKDYQQGTLGFHVVRGTSVVRDVATVGQVQGTVVRGSIALWLDFGDSKLHADGYANPVSVPEYNQTGAFASDSAGRLWICNGQYGLMVRAWDIPYGWWLSRDAFNFFPDMIALPDGRFRLISSMNQGESAGANRVWDFDPRTGAYTFNGAPGQAELQDLNTNTHADPSVLTPPATIAPPLVAGAGSTADLFPIAVGAAMLGAYFLIHRGE